MQLALGLLMETIWKEHELVFRLETKPAKKVFATWAQEPGTIVLIPYSDSLVVDETNEANKANKIMTGVTGSDGKPVWIAKPALAFPKPSEQKKAGAMELFWCVRDLERPKKVPGGEAPVDPEAKNINMHLVNYRVLGAIAIKKEEDSPGTDVS